jgi:hypothetical protein
VLEGVVRIIAVFGPGAMWFLVFFAALVAVFVLYVGIALFATLRAADEPRGRSDTNCFVTYWGCSVAGTADERRAPRAPRTRASAGLSAGTRHPGYRVHRQGLS